MIQKITEDLEEPQESDFYLIHDKYGGIHDIFYKFSSNNWREFNGNYWTWKEIVSQHSTGSYEIELLSSYSDSQRDVTFIPELLAEKLSADGEFVMIEADSNESFSCSQCDFSLQKEGWFTDSVPDFHYCPNCGGKVKNTSELTGK